MAQASKPLEDQTLEFETTPQEHEVRLEPSPRRVRAMFGGETIADSKDVILVFESKHMPVYYFPRQDVRTDLLSPTSRRSESAHRGIASHWTVRTREREAVDAAWSYEDPPHGQEGIKGYVAFYWDQMEAWFEEDDEVFVHPRDPYHRVDVLNSSRHVQVVVGGETVADTRRPRLLFETGLPTRYYVPKVDARMDLLVPSDTTTACPYKGRAVYWHLEVGDRLYRDYVWSYPAPIPECPKIENLLCFFNERVDSLIVEGEVQPVPKTPWS
jgi:uncharacterized protein (DUF427 family)